MKLKPFQLEDYARAALHDGLILAHDTGLGKTWAAFLIPLLKLGFETAPTSLPSDLRPLSSSLTPPNAPAASPPLLLSPASRPPDPAPRSALCPRGTVLIVAPGDLHPQIISEGLTVFRIPVTPLDSQETFLKLSTLDPATGRRLLPPGFYITSYTQLGVNGRQRAGTTGPRGEDGIPLSPSRAEGQGDGAPSPLDCGDLSPLSPIGDLSPMNSPSSFSAPSSVLRPPPSSSTPSSFPPPPPSPTPPHAPVAPSLSDLCRDSFDHVVIDEGVRIKGDNTLISLGVRQLNPRYRLVLTATPIKNRLPDFFWLAWWACGGRPEAHARFPYNGDPADREAFANEFMVEERNLTKEENHYQTTGQRRRFKKHSPQVCNIHRIWKLIAPILLRRRKQDIGEQIVKMHRHIIRVAMGRNQAAVYDYHINAKYLDKNDQPAPGAKLQALRLAAADPTSPLLHAVGGEPTVAGGASENSLFSSRRDGQGEGSTPSSSVFSVPSVVLPHLPSSSSVSPESSVVPSSSAPFLLDCGDSSPLSSIDDLSPMNSPSSFPPPPPDLRPPSSVLSPQHRSPHPYTPKLSTALQLILQILQRHEQVAIGAAFHDPLNLLSRYLTQASVPHLHLDGRINPRARGKLSLQFQQGRIPVALAGVQSMANGHNWYRCRNIILLAYDWAYDNFEQFINRAYRLTSPQDVHLYCLIANGTTDRKLEQNIGEKSDASELVLDGRLLTDPPQEVNLAELLQIARHEWSGALSSIASAKEGLIDESVLAQEWPSLRAQLQSAAAAWRPAESPLPQCRSRRQKALVFLAKPPPLPLVIQTITQPTTPPLHNPVVRSPLSVVSGQKSANKPAPSVLRSPSSDLCPPSSPPLPSLPLWQLRLYRLI